jgi:hypothetical protein
MFSSGVNLGGGGRLPSGSGGGGAATSVDYENWDASGDAYPTTYAGGAIVKGNQYIVTVASPPDGNGDIKFPLGAILIARSNAPAQVDANWKIVQA